MPVGVKFKIEGVKEMKRALKRVVEHYPKRVMITLRRIGERIMRRSKAEFVPVDTGTLRSTGHVESFPTRIKIRLIYGGPSATYALDQHENFTYHHEVGGPKYLERPLMEEVKGMAQEIAAKTPLRK